MTFDSDKTESLPMLEPSETKDLLKAAIERGGVDAIERVAALYERAQEKASERAFHDAMAQFTAAMKPIRKTAKANIVTKSGSEFQYSYAPLDEIARTIAGPLHEAGLSYTWNSHVENDRITITCIVRHVDGHSIDAKFSCPIDPGTGAGMNAQQKNGAALTYGRRYSLIQALGLTTCDPDTDCADTGANAEKITDHQAADLECLIEEVGADCMKFLAWIGANSIQEIRQSDYSRAVRALEAKRKG